VSTAAFIGIVQTLVGHDAILGSKLLRYGTNALGILLAICGAALLTASFGWRYLAAFLTAGLSAGVSASLLVFRALWASSAAMIEIGEASVFTFLYYALTTGLCSGLLAGASGVLIYAVWRLRKASRIPGLPQ